MRSRVFVLALIIALLLSLTIGTLGAAASGGCQPHYVSYGETLYSIGRMYNVDPYAIAAYNGLTNPDYLVPGQYLCIPYGPPYPGYGYPGYPYPPVKVHCVRYGETLYSIGRMYNVDPYAIAAYNGLADPNYIQGGQCLTIPPGPPYYGYYYYPYPVPYGYGYPYDP